jgi:hypothetical protein
MKDDKFGIVKRLQGEPPLKPVGDAPMTVVGNFDRNVLVGGAILIGTFVALGIILIGAFVALGILGLLVFGIRQLF